jgi:ABC-type lipoprotein release transport system permease subunit
MYLQIALKSIFSRKKQYRSLFLVCIAGFCISLLCLSLMNGMLSSLYQKARIYYGGDLQFIGGDNDLGDYDTPKVMENLKKVFSDDNIIICPRYEVSYSGRDITLFFEGVGVSQRIIKGVDFDIEKNNLNNLTFIAGGVENIADTNSILISEPIAQKLHVKINDSITMMKSTHNGFQNTAQFIVAGIFRDSSLFGMYTSYIDREHLLILNNDKPGLTNRIGIFFNDSSKLTTKKLNEYQAKLETLFTNMYPLTDNKEDYYAYKRKLPSKVESYALITLNANLRDLQLLISAMRLILYSIIIVLALIIAIGIGNSYKVIVIKRIQEIGMYRALGMSIHSINAIFLTETSIVISSGFIIGLLLQYIFSNILATIDFSFIPAFDVFLQNGSLAPKLQFYQTVILFIGVAVTTLLSVLFTIRKGVTVSPVDALSTTE